MFKPSDKNVSLTIMDLSLYLQECYRQLSDEKVYKELSTAGLDQLLLKIKSVIW